LDLFAKNSHDILQQLKSTDISVPPIEQGRTTEHCERWSICRFLATLTKHTNLEFPIKLIKRERPDFCLHIGKKQVGIEFTEAIQPDYARARVLPEANSADSILDPSLFKWGSSKKSLSELRSMAAKKKLTGPGWNGNEMEDEWSCAIADITHKKTEKLNSEGFAKFSENWLLIYDNLDSGNIDISCSPLINDLGSYWSANSFDKILVETGDFIIEIKEGKFRKLKLNDLWKQ